jgi:hypothetical protein
MGLPEGRRYQEISAEGREPQETQPDEYSTQWYSFIRFYSSISLVHIHKWLYEKKRRCYDLCTAIHSQRIRISTPRFCFKCCPCLPVLKIEPILIQAKPSSGFDREGGGRWVWQGPIQNVWNRFCRHAVTRQKKFKIICTEFTAPAGVIRLGKIAKVLSFLIQNYRQGVGLVEGKSLFYTNFDLNQIGLFWITF